MPCCAALLCPHAKRLFVWACDHQREHAPAFTPFSSCQRGCAVPLSAPRVFAAAAEPAELDDLHLTVVLGEGASGVVLRGMHATTPVAVRGDVY